MVYIILNLIKECDILLTLHQHQAFNNQEKQMQIIRYDKDTNTLYVAPKQEVRYTSLNLVVPK